MAGQSNDFGIDCFDEGRVDFCSICIIRWDGVKILSIERNNNRNFTIL